MWTEQSIESLRRFANEGKSAAWIAAALGAPSRNAVIGKANRIGVKLNGGPVRSGLKPPRPETAWGPKRARSSADDSRSDGRLGQAPRGRSVSRARTRLPAISREKLRMDRWMFASAEVGEMRRIALAEIGEVECRWPIGDPLQDDFAYCGLPIARGHAYCAGHCRLAYRTTNS
jgi:GcrA cell cycle regulator